MFLSFNIACLGDSGSPYVETFVLYHTIGRLLWYEYPKVVIGRPSDLQMSITGKHHGCP